MSEHDEGSVGAPADYQEGDVLVHDGKRLVCRGFWEYLASDQFQNGMARAQAAFADAARQMAESVSKVAEARERYTAAIDLVKFLDHETFDPPGVHHVAVLGALRAGKTFLALAQVRALKAQGFNVFTVEDLIGNLPLQGGDVPGLYQLQPDIYGDVMCEPPEPKRPSYLRHDPTKQHKRRKRR